MDTGVVISTSHHPETTMRIVQSPDQVGMSSIGSFEETLADWWGKI
jgi:hypothetical protein